MAEYLTIEEMKWISSDINNQKGRKYPCSNQVVICGFFGSEEEWKEFCFELLLQLMKQNKEILERLKERGDRNAILC